jgi:hypothetical protein
MVTFTAALLQTRQTAVSLHLLSSLVHSLRQLPCFLLACFLPRMLDASPRRCLLDVPTSLRPFITFTRFPIMSSICSRVGARSYSLLVIYRCAGKKFTVDATTSIHASTPLHFVDSIPNDDRANLMLKTPLPTVITFRSPTPITAINFFFFQFIFSRPTPSTTSFSS